MSNTMYARLNKARQEFADAKIEPTGINRHQQYTYYELENIVPTAREVLTKNDLMMTFQYTNGHACVELIDLSPEKSDRIQFVYEFSRAEAYKGMNDIQSFGADLKYLRRYCYMCLLDITEPDDINQLDNTPVEPQEVKTAPAPTPVPAPAPNGLATVEMKTTLVEKLKELKALDAEQDDFVQTVVKEINTITVEKCLVLIANIKEMIAQYEVK